MFREKFVSRTRECVLTIAESEVQAVRRADVTRTGVRLYEGGVIGVAGRLGEASYEDLLPAAQESLEAGLAYPFEPGADLVKHCELRAELEDDATLLSEVEAILAALVAEQPAMIFSHQAAVLHEEVHLENEQGLDLRHDGREVRLLLIFKERGSPNIVDGIIGSSGRRYDRGAYLTYANELCGAFSRRVELPEGSRHRVVISAGSGLSMPLDYFARHLNGRRFGQGASPLAARRGELVFHPDFHLDQTRHPDDTSLPFFDVEGVCHESMRVPLVEAGVVVGPYTDRRTAAQFGLPLTGAASAAYDGVPGLGVPTLRARPGERTLAELLGGEPGVFVSITAGGDSTNSGDFSAPVQLAFLHDGEKLLGRLPDLSIRGNLHHMLGDDFVGISSDCVPGFGSDHQLVTEMEVTARG